MANARTPSTTAKRRPGPDIPAEDELELFSRLRRASLMLDALQRDSLDELGLSFVDYSALKVLDLTGPPYQLSPSRMAELLVRTTGGMTKIVDRLERRGFVARVRDGQDRRSVLVVLTDEGMAMSRKASASYRVSRKRLLTQLSPEEVEAIVDHLDLLVQAFERDHEANPEG